MQIIYRVFLIMQVVASAKAETLIIIFQFPCSKKKRCPASNGTAPQFQTSNIVTCVTLVLVTDNKASEPAWAGTKGRLHFAEV